MYKEAQIFVSVMQFLEPGGWLGWRWFVLVVNTSFQIMENSQCSKNTHKYHKTGLEKRTLAIDVPIKYTHITVNSELDAEVCKA